MSALSSLEAELTAKNAATQARTRQMKAQKGGSSLSKRKREPSDDEGGALEDASLQLAMALQQEDENADAMDLDHYSSPRRRDSSRPLRPLVPKAVYVLDSDEDEAKPLSLSRPKKKSRFQSLDSDNDEHKPLATKNKKATVQITDSDDEDDEYDAPLSEDSEASVVASTPSKQTKTTPSKTTVMNSPVRQRGRPKPSQSSPATTGQPSRGRGRGRPRKSKIWPPKLTENSSNKAITPSPPHPRIDSSDPADDDDSFDLEGLVAAHPPRRRIRGAPLPRPMSRDSKLERRAKQERRRLELHHPEIKTMWKQLEVLGKIPKVQADQPTNISRTLKPFQLEGLHWMQQVEKTQWGGGLLGDEMGMGKTIQAVSLIMSDYPAKHPSLVLVPPVALMQWQQEIGEYTDGTLKTFVYHGSNAQLKNTQMKDLKGFDVILLSYNSLESMFRAQEKGRTKDGKPYKVKSPIHQLQFHRVILDEAHCIKQRQSGTAKACFALTADHKWCLSGTPLQNRIGEFFSLIRFLDVRPFACYFCKQCPCSKLEWAIDTKTHRCGDCGHHGMQHVSVFNQELLNPIQKHGNVGPGKAAFEKLKLLTDRFMLRRVKRDHSSSMELPAKEIFVDRHFFGEVENDFASSIMNNSKRKFETYVNQNVMMNNYANIFGLIMQMRQVADHPDLLLKRDVAGGQNVLVCSICADTAEDPVRSLCKHDFCRSCVKVFLGGAAEDLEDPDCPRCNIRLSIDLEQAAVAQDFSLVKKTSIINRIKMESWTSSSKIEALVYDLHELRSKNSSCKSIIFSQFTSMLQLVEWRLHRAGIITVMLDGSMTPTQRQASINRFMTDVKVECFLVSLKAGGVALNLTEASKVFIIDPWWNPAAEWQSADRCHRIGQTRPCSITRLCIEDSVESRMVLLQEKKANMINSTINNDTSAMESLTPEDMQFLFRGT